MADSDNPQDPAPDAPVAAPGETMAAGGAAPPVQVAALPTTAAAPVALSMPDEIKYPFDFEAQRRSTYRSYEKARADVIQLLGRLGVPDPRRALASDHVIEKRLLVYGVESLLNITYYGAAASRELRSQRWMNGGIYLIVLAFTGATVWAFVRGGADAVGQAASSQIAAVAAAVLAGVKFLTGSHDFQRTRSSFWQAGADLKDRLYHFISDWHGKAWDAAEGAFRPEFVVALQAEIKRARDVQEEERRRFYDMMQQPTTLIGSASQLGTDTQAQIAAYVTADQQRRDKARSRELEELRKQRDELVEIYPNEIDRNDAVKARLRELERRIKQLENEQAAAAGIPGLGSVPGLPPPPPPSGLAPLPPPP